MSAHAGRFSRSTRLIRAGSTPAGGSRPREDNRSPPGAVKMRFDTYLRYDDLTRALHALAAAHPALVRIESIGKSFEGRDIWLATATRFDSGDDRDKPALWVDGNIHATEVAGSMACLYLLHHLVTQYGTDPEVTRCLDTRVFYVCPRLNPDGAEWALADVPRIIRSSTRPYPYDEEPIAGLRREDVDGDGRVLTMRVPDPNGAVEGLRPRSAADGPPRSDRNRRPLLPPAPRRDDRRLGRRHARARPAPRAARPEPQLPGRLAAGARAARRRALSDLGAGGARGGGVHRVASEHHRRDPVPHLQRRAAAAVLAPGRRHAPGGGPVDLPEARGERAPSSPVIRTSRCSTISATTRRR